MTAGFKLGSYSETVRGEFVVPDEGFYVMTLDDWDEPVRSAYVDKETGEYPWRVNLKFKIVADVSGDIEFEGATVGKFVDVDLNPNAKGSIWAVLKALDPMNDPEPGGAIEAYRGQKLIGAVTHTVKDKRGGKPGEKVTYANLGDCKPFKKAKKEAAPKRNPLLEDEE